MVFFSSSCNRLQPVWHFSFLGPSSHEIAVVMLLQVITGILLLSNRFVPLALALLAPIIVNIVLFHTFMAPQGLPVALFTSILWLLTFTGVRSAFSGLFQVRVRAKTEQG